MRFFSSLAVKLVGREGYWVEVRNSKIYYIFRNIIIKGAVTRYICKN